MSLRYGRLFDATVREEYERALTLAKTRLGPILPERALPLTDITAGGRWQDTPLIKSRLAAGYCLRTTAQGTCSYAKRLRNAKLVFRASRVLDAGQAGIYRRPGPAPGHGGRPRTRRHDV